MIGLREISLFILLFFCGIAGAILGGERFGFLAGLVGFPLGIIVAFGLLYSIIMAGVYLEAFFITGIPRYPTCHNGKCRAEKDLLGFGDYNSVQLPTASGAGDWGLQCRCGNLYKHVGRQFFEVTADGIKKPYMIYRPFKGWISDQESN